MKTLTILWVIFLKTFLKSVLNGGRQVISKFLNCDNCDKQCIMYYHKNHLKSKTHNNSFNKPTNIWKYRGFYEDDIDN